MPPYKTHPNLNTDTLLNNVQEVSQIEWLLALFILIDEHTVCFKIHHLCQGRIKYKSDGDGFQMY